MNTTTRTLTVVFLLAVAAVGVETSWAAAPPVWINYQGVLRDAANNPLDGTHDMVFRFYSGLDEEILIDRHTTAQGGAVTVSGGLFNVALGTGSTADGSGPGTYGSLVEVFRDYNEVHLEVQIGADGAPGTEVLTPRTRVISAPYALNASNLAGLPATSLLRSNESDVYTFGTLTFNPTTTLDLGGTLNMGGAVTKATTDHVANLNADLLDGNDSSAFAASEHGHTGAEIVGPVGEAGNADTLDGHDSTYFLNTSSAAEYKAGPLSINTSGVPGYIGLQAMGEVIGGAFSSINGTGWARLASGDHGVHASGTSSGGYFQDSDDGGWAWVGYDSYGIHAEGSSAGASFYDEDSSGWARVANGDYGITAHGNTSGGYFTDSDSSGYAYVGYGNRGIEATGSEAGGYFSTGSGSGHAWIGYLDEGIAAHGTVQGGFFQDDDSTGQAHVAYGNVGIDASGSGAGGVFHDSDGTGSANVATGHYGITAYGSITGGFFGDNDSSGYAWVGWGDGGVYGFGNSTGGYFEDTDNTGYAYVGYGDSGIEAYGGGTGGYFEDTDATAHTYVAVGNIGVDARGSQGGGYFADNFSTGWSYVGYDTYKVYGVGSVAFVQNHPYEPDKVIAYNAPEGDEVATYTRGTARLQNGEARVTLGETFTWVTNPDLGLTAHVTPRSADAVVYVESVSTKELVVRNVTGFPGDAVFDYLVYGLRIGFEEKSVVQPKKLESYIPSMAGDRTLYEQAPGLRPYNAFERFKGMREVVFLDEVDPLDLTASHALRDAIHEYDPASDPPLGDLAGHGLGRRKDRPARPESSEPESPVVPETDPDSDSVPAVVGIPSQSPGEEPRGDAEVSPAYPTFPVSEPVEVGDLMVLDPERPGRLRRCLSAADVNVIGIVVGDPATSDGDLQIPVALSDLAVVKADAGYGEIRPGDLLTSSFTPGHAMRAGEIVPGTIIGKALEPLETGTGLIKVLVMPR